MKKHLIVIILPSICFFFFGLEVKSQCSVSYIQAINGKVNEMGTPKIVADDKFDVDINVEYTNPPSTGLLTVTMGSLSQSVQASGLINHQQGYTFKNFQLPVDGKPINVQAYFSAFPSCSLSSDVGNAPEPYKDTDGDGVFDHLDTDDDNDGLADTQECKIRRKITDLVLLVDSSNSIWRIRFQTWKTNIAEALQEMFDENSYLYGFLRLTVIEFSTYSAALAKNTAVSVLEPTLLTSSNLRQILDVIRNMSYLDDSTFVAPAIDMSVNTIANNPISDPEKRGKKIIDIITDDAFQDSNDALIKASNNAQNNGFDELNMIALNPYDSEKPDDFIKNKKVIFPKPEGGNEGFYFYAPSFDQLKDLFTQTLRKSILLDCEDFDKDGLIDPLDIDDDDDGIPDNIEIQTTASYLVPSGMDSDNDGLDDTYDPDSGGKIIIPVDTDADGIPDYLDKDSDGDGKSDIKENGFGLDPSNIDTDNDGLDDSYDNEVGYNPAGDIKTSGTKQLVEVFGDDNKNVDTTNNIAIPLRQDLDFREAICNLIPGVGRYDEPSIVLITGSKSNQISRKHGQLVIDSDKGGLVIPRVSSPETSIKTPKDGMIVFDTDDNCLKLYKESIWGCIDKDCPSSISGARKK